MWDGGWRTQTAVPLLIIIFFHHFDIQVSARAIISDDNLVHTTLGDIRGTKQVFDGVEFTAFLGIPYARPPIESRRFAKPERIDGWNGELEARHPAKTCHYTVDKTFPDFPGAEMWNPPPTSPLSEDCLSLNIWVPPKHDGSVMVWIYGGGFFSGSPSLDLYDGTVLATKYNKIVVNINYRLGPFGFLYLGGDTEIPGNMGLLDQQMALEWVHTHINSFGGDPGRVTLFGESAGSASVTAHLIAPNSHQFFSRIITKSGAITNSWATRSKETLLETTLHLARLVNCTSQGEIDKKAVARCLRNINPLVLQEQADQITNQINLPMTFAFSPVDDEPNFFQGNLWDRLRRREFKKDVSALMGTVADEGTYWLPYFLLEKKFGFAYNHTISSEDPQNKARIDRVQYKNSIDAFLPYFGNSPLIEHSLMHAYSQVSHSDIEMERLRDGVARFLGDYFFTCGLIDFADLLADNIYGPVYMYYFTMRSSANPWPRWMGVMHGYEIEYVFGQPFRKPILYDNQRLQVEQKFSETIMQMWIDFSNTGMPAYYWPKYNRVERKSLVLSEEIIHGVHRIKEDIHGSHCRLLAEAKAVVGQVALNGVECRSRRTGAQAVSSSSSSSSLSLGLFIITLFFINS